MNGIEGLAAFTEARFAEDEAAAKAASPSGQRLGWRAEADAGEDGPDIHWVVADDGTPALMEALGLERGTGRAVSAHAARHDPARTLREAGAGRKRVAAMIEAHAEMDRLLADPHAGDVERAMAIGRARAATVAVKTDAEVHDGHPDFREEWRP